MNRTQWLVIGVVFFLTAGLFALTYDKIFGYHPQLAVATDEHEGHDHQLSIDTILQNAKAGLSPELHKRADNLQATITAEQDPAGKLHLYHQAAQFWKDSSSARDPYLWYTGEAARLENSEKNLTFAAHLFLNNLKGETSPEIKEWKALQSKDLFERSLKLNPQNDSARIGLGAAQLFGGLSSNPMEAILKIREVADRDSNNVYAQLTLGEASVLSGQLDKALERYFQVVRIQPKNWEALLALGDVFERRGQKKQAVEWYQRSLPLVPYPALKTELENRIKILSQ
jgi:tetratricopeptide (TPR) repeat protein